MRFLLPLSLLLPAFSSLAQPITNPANGHAYEAVAGEMTWEQARTAAAARSFQGAQGHLATLTSRDETDFLINTFGPRDSYALGGIQTGSDEPAGGWSWITGEAWDYTDWDSGEPNNAFIDNEFENRLAWKTGTVGRWNDVAGDVDEGPGQGQYRMNGYFVEYEPCPADFNDDGFVDFFDFNDFVSCFEGDTCPDGKTADFNNDGFADFFDFNDFIAAFEAGC